MYRRKENDENGLRVLKLGQLLYYVKFRFLYFCLLVSNTRVYLHKSVFLFSKTLTKQGTLKQAKANLNWIFVKISTSNGLIIRILKTCQADQTAFYLRVKELKGKCFQLFNQPCVFWDCLSLFIELFIFKRRREEEKYTNLNHSKALITALDSQIARFNNGYECYVLIL